METTLDNKSEPLTTIKNFLESLAQFSQQQTFRDAQSLVEEVAILNTKIQSQDETMMKMTNDLVRAQKQIETVENSWRDKCDQNYRDIFRVHVQEVDQLQAEKSSVQTELSDARTAFDQKKKQNDELQQISQQHEQQAGKNLKEIKELRAKLGISEAQNSKLEKEIRSHEARMKADEDKFKKETQKIEKLETTMKKLETNRDSMGAQLREQATALEKIKGFAPRLARDDVNEASTSLHGIWQRCLQTVQRCFAKPIPNEILEDPNAWKSLTSSEHVAYMVPVPPSNSLEAKKMRIAVTLANIADSLIRNIFTATYLLSDDSEMRNVLFHLAETEGDKEAFFRRLLNSISEEKEAYVINQRIAKVVSEVSEPVRSLLSPEDLNSFQSELQTILQEATQFWKSAQRRSSHFESDLDAISDVPWKWNVMNMDEGTPLSVPKEVSSEEFARHEVALVVFPRVFMIDGQADRPTFPGIVLLKSQTIAAVEEVNQIRLSSPGLGRSSTNRSRPRRTMTQNGQIERNPGMGLGIDKGGPFLD